MTRQEKIERYIECVIDNMDYKTMYRYVYDTIKYSMEHDHTDEEIDDLYNEYFEEQWWQINKP